MERNSMCLNRIIVRIKEAKNLPVVDKRGTPPSTFLKVKPNFIPIVGKSKLYEKNINPIYNFEFQMDTTTHSPLSGLGKNKTSKKGIVTNIITIQVIDKSSWKSVCIGIVNIICDEKFIGVEKWFQIENESKKKKGERGELYVQVELPGSKAVESSKVALENKYTIGDEIGRGAFSIVYKGISIDTKELVAIKKVMKSKQMESQIKFLQREIKVMSQLQHEHIVRLLDVFEDNESIFMIMEYISGGELYDYIIERGSLTEKDAVNLIHQILDASNYMHDKGIAHRDLKPENLLCADNKGENIKIADFGLSKEFGNQSVMNTCCGSPSYVAPEVLDGREYTLQCDIWSIGVITYVLLSGYLPFFGDNQEELFDKILKCDYSFDYPCWEEVSDDGKDFIRKCLTLDPMKRLSASELLRHCWISQRSGARTYKLDFTTSMIDLKRGGLRPKTVR